ncbi:MAG TPA: proteasome accessory factor PafA2 family protein [Armatimonadota bacterium]|nr:proteasome accessory factor PafA2 family protein [Armatimonadota bacterium]
MRERLMGLEVEYGCLVRDASLGRPEQVVELLKDYAFNDLQIGLVDRHARDFAFEPAQAGGFLTNGGRLYIDAVGDHLEYATPEVTRLDDLVAHDRAGQRTLLRLVDGALSRDAVSFHNNSIDHFGGHTFGCHENYAVSIPSDSLRVALTSVVSFLVSRLIYAGAGRVGGHRLTRGSPRDLARQGHRVLDTLWVGDVYGVEADPGVRYQLSQRADHIRHAMSGRVRFNRAIINPKSDTFCDLTGEWRLHVLFGESNMSQYATALKVGTTGLVLTLAELGLLSDDTWLARPVASLRRISRDESHRWIVALADGGSISAVDHQRRYLELAQRYLAGCGGDADWVIGEWSRVLDDLEGDPRRLVDRLDWVAKEELLRLYVDEEGISWQDEVLHSLDLEYHNIDPRSGLFYSLEELGRAERLVSDDRIECAMRSPPEGTRARARAQVVRAILERGHRNYAIDWDSIRILGEKEMLQLDLDTPEGPPPEVIDRFCQGLDRVGRFDDPDEALLWIV